MNQALIRQFYRLINTITTKEKSAYRIKPLLNQITYILIKLQLADKEKQIQKRDFHV